MLEFIESIASEIIVAFIVGIGGLAVNWAAKKRDDARTAREEARDAQEELRRTEANQKIDDAIAEMRGVASRVEELSGIITNLGKEVSELRENDQVQNRMIRGIASTNRINGQCTSELAQLVMTLAEGMRDQHLDGNITKAIDTYRRFESTTLKNILSGSNQYNQNSGDDLPPQI